jgi:hypothetical protein
MSRPVSRFLFALERLHGLRRVVRMILLASILATCGALLPLTGKLPSAFACASSGWISISASDYAPHVGRDGDL